jgi:hypothetical protein
MIEFNGGLLMEKNYLTLKLQGSAADLAIDCFRKEQILPASPLVEGSKTSTVTVGQFDEINAKIEGTDPTNAGRVEELTITPAHSGKPTEAIMPNVQVTGGAAETIQQKAAGCVTKSLNKTLGFTP